MGDALWVIQVQQDGCRATTGGYSLNQRTIETNVAMPTLCSWVEQGHDSPVHRVNRCEVRTFEPITREAGPREVLQGGGAAMLLCDHMVRFVRIIGIGLVDSAVLASPVRPILYLASQPLRYRGRHGATMPALATDEALPV